MGKTGYQPEKYDNPSLQWHYKILQAIALEEELPEKPEDKTIPKYRLIDKHTREQVAEWAQVFEDTIGPLDVSMEKESYGKRLADTGSGHVKRQRAGPVGSGTVVDAYKNGSLPKVSFAFIWSRLLLTVGTAYCCDAQGVSPRTGPTGGWKEGRSRQCCGGVSGQKRIIRVLLSPPCITRYPYHSLIIQTSSLVPSISTS